MTFVLRAHLVPVWRMQGGEAGGQEAREEATEGYGQDVGCLELGLSQLDFIIFLSPPHQTEGL